MKKNFILPLAAIFVFSILSCENALIPASTPVSVNDSSRTGAPTGLTASQGCSGCVKLSWMPVSGASRYYIYGTDKPTPRESDFVQVDQTSNTSINVNVKPGSTAWYKIAAVDSKYVAGSKSIAVRGTSLAQPEITDIKSFEEDDEINITVQWYMANCSDDTYRQEISYEILCKDEQGKDSSAYVAATDLTENTYTFTSLAPHTKYSVQVIAVNKEYGDTEESILLTEETLHRLRPSSPENLEADCGIFTDKIHVSFTAPEEADVYYTVDGSYAKIPLYFKIYRRAAGETSWTEKQSKFQPTNYVAGETLVWTDTLDPQNRGKKFEYKVQSYIDKTKLKAIKDHYQDADDKNYTLMETSEKSSSIATGWTMAVPKLSAKDYRAQKGSEETKYESASVGFALTWNNFLLDNDELNKILSAKYGYLIYENFTPFAGDTSKVASQNELKYFSDISEIGSYTRTFTLGDDMASSERGKYTYTVYIVSKDDRTKDNALTFANSGQITVTDNAESISGFTVKGGYTDKFILNWENNPAYTYTLSYTQAVNGTSDGTIYEVDISSVSGSYVDTTDILKEGVSRVYTLSAENTSSTAAPISSTSDEVYSLGEPELLFDENEPSYDSINIKWKALPAANKYTISFDGKEKYTDLTVDSDRITTVQDENGIQYQNFTLSREDLGSDYFGNAKASGIYKTVTVKASSDVANSTGSTNARTLGPASVELSASVAAKENSIKVEWNTVPGTTGYVLQRYRFKVSGTSYIRDEDTPELFFVDSETETIKTNAGESIDPAAMDIIAENGKIILNDNYASIPESEKETASQRQITQARIPWGIPVEYTVIPVLSEKDSFSNGKLKPASNSGEIIYAEIDSKAKKGSAIGYGLNVHASKADSSKSVTIKWDRPYTGNASVTPFIYRRPKGNKTAYSDGAGIRINNKLETSAVEPSSGDTGAYEYAVKYIADNYKMGADPFVESYMEELASSMDEISTEEQKNVGYTFTLTDFKATSFDSSQKESFTTTVTWSPWNYTKRALGPEDSSDGTAAYTIWTKNLNVAPGWFQIGQMTTDGTVSVVADQPDWYDARIGTSVNCLTLTPNGLTDTTGENLGLLKVQRDQKQYYMIRAQRKNSEGKTVYTYLGLDGSVGAYRKISTEEFTKNVLLILADALDQAGISDDTKDFVCTGYNGIGRFMNNHQGGTKNFHYGTDGKDYLHRFWNLPGMQNTENSNSIYFVSGYTISIPRVETRAAADGHKAFYFPEGKITVKHISGQTSYNGTINFTAGEKGKENGVAIFDSVKTSYKLTASATQSSGSSVTLSANTNDGMKAIFPFDMFTDREKSVTTYNSSHAQYKGKWWDIKEGSKLTSEFVDVEGE